MVIVMVIGPLQRLFEGVGLGRSSYQAKWIRIGSIQGLLLLEQGVFSDIDLGSQIA